VANYTFKQYTIAAAGTPQPLVGTTLSAAVAASPGQPVTVAVADASPWDIYGQGFAAAFDVPVYAVFGKLGASEERVRVLQVVDGTHIKVDQLAFAHANAIYVRLGAAVNSVYVQSKDGNTGNFLYIGNSPNMVKATMTYCLAKLAKVAALSQPTEFSDTRTGAWNPGDAANCWIDGDTTGDGYVPSFGVV